MEKREYLVFLFCLILCYSLFQPTARAQSSSQISISSQGSITYSPSNVNLAVIPDDWDLTYGSGPQIIFLDNTAVRTAGKPSIRLERHTSADQNAARECDCKWYLVKPGDHIVASCWIKAEPSQLGDTNPASGGRIGIDLWYTDNPPHWGNKNYILWGISSSTYENPYTYQGEVDNYVHFGTSVWMQRTIDFVVPDTYFTKDQLTGQTISPVKPNVICMWTQVWSSTYGAADPARAWFADAELYINPT
jgi:hypothetical protein